MRPTKTYKPYSHIYLTWLIFWLCHTTRIESYQWKGLWMLLITMVWFIEVAASSRSR